MSRNSKMQRLKRAEYEKALEELSLVRVQLREAENRFDLMTGGDQLDVCILEISALRSKYNCAIRSIKTIFF